VLTDVTPVERDALMAEFRRLHHAWSDMRQVAETAEYLRTVGLEGCRVACATRSRPASSSAVCWLHERRPRPQARARCVGRKRRPSSPPRPAGDARARAVGTHRQGASAPIDPVPAAGLGIRPMRSVEITVAAVAATIAFRRRHASARDVVTASDWIALASAIALLNRWGTRS
jgi:hypothetical protein